MEKYVVSRERAENLRAAGYPDNTTHYWHRIMRHDAITWGDWKVHDFPGGDFAEEHTAAPMTDELLERLPKVIQSTANGHAVSYHFSIAPAISGRWVVTYAPIKEDIISRTGSASLANALADMWLWCKENGHV